jgi:hypothetical protein
MPRYFFDILEAEKLWEDTEGSSHPDLQTARREAVDTLTAMSREAFPLEGPYSLRADIRGEDGRVLERVVITLSFQRF